MDNRYEKEYIYYWTEKVHFEKYEEKKDSNKDKVSITDEILKDLEGFHETTSNSF